MIDRATLVSSIDQTLLDPTVGPRAGAEWIAANAGFGFASLCVSPFLVPAAARALAGTPTKVCSVCAFPLGYATTAAKAAEARRLVAAGCAEVDMVMNCGAMLEGDAAYVAEDIAAVHEAVIEASDGAALLKVILETGRLTPELVAQASVIAVRAGAEFVKTSTGFGPRGASVEDVRIMRQAVGPDVGVKAAGGIRDLATALAMLEAGATRIGASGGARIMAAFDAQAGAGA